MPNRIKLCAIAKNEGAYLADWVFHHLYFGFDAIEVWINGTDDRSVQIMESIRSHYPQVGFKDADRVLTGLLAEGGHFQHHAYARMAAKAARRGFSHVAFLDLDEYWTPQDFASPIADFVPEDDQVNVVSFQWCRDTPDPDREPFGHVVGDSVALQLDPHVKSVVRLDDRVEQFRTHTARTSSGARWIVDSPFPLKDEVRQQWGSLLPYEYVVEHWERLPAAFVLHAIHRSQTEYVASLAKGLRQTGADLDLKTNRAGFAPTAAPELEFRPDRDALAAYFREHGTFLATIQADPLVLESRTMTVARADALLAAALEDESVMSRLRGPLHNVASPELDSRYPGWDAFVECRFDIEILDGRPWITGWAYGARGEQVELGIRDGSGKEWLDLGQETVPRPDVVRGHPVAPVDCGFRIRVPGAVVGDLGHATLVARVSEGQPFWDVAGLAGAAARFAANDELKELARRAARMARAEGHDWSTLSRATRLEYRRRAQLAGAHPDAE